jgi:hypothetical protein
MAFEVGNWRVTSTKDGHGRKVDDSPVLMRRPDGQPCEVQAQYVAYYKEKGFEVVNDPLEFDDVIPTKFDLKPKQKSKAELRKERDAKKEKNAK